MKHVTNQVEGSWHSVSRRAFLRRAAGTSAALVAIPAASSALARQAGTPPPGAASAPPATPLPGTTAAPPHQFSTFPIPGTRTASLNTEISFRGPALPSLETIRVVGTLSGEHSGVVIRHSDGHGASFVPDAAFNPGEEVLVTTDLDLLNGTNGRIKFGVATPIIERFRISTRRVTNRDGVQTYQSRPDLKPPELLMTATGTTAPGAMFLGPKTPYSQNGVMIFDNDGQVIWFLPLSNPTFETNNFRMQQYKGRPVLTWWEGVSAKMHGFGHYRIVDQSYQSVAYLQVANGYHGGDLHEFLITPQNTALVTIFNTVRWDLTPVGGTPDGSVREGIVQELDIETGRVLFEWHSLDHIPLTETYLPLAADKTFPYDYVHLNSIDVDRDGHLIVSSRYTSTVYKIDHRTGDVIWRLGGKDSNFKMGPGTVTAFQHDARIRPNGHLTVFDNSADNQGNKAPGVASRSRGIEMALDQTAMTATLVAEYIHPGTVLTTAQGNVETLPNGNVFIGWGVTGYSSEFTHDGRIVLDSKLPDGAYSYRAFRNVWAGYPTDPPAIAAQPAASGGLTVYASWNGATEVATWDVLAGADPSQLKSAGSANRNGFETAIPVDSSPAYVAVQAKSAAGDVLGTSKTIKTNA